MFTIYALVDPRDSAVRYIGCTSWPVEMRLRAHCTDLVGYRRGDWIRELLAADLRPSAIVLQRTASEQEAMDLERAWYFRFLEAGAQLTNGMIPSAGAPGRHLRPLRRTG